MKPLSSAIFLCNVMKRNYKYGEITEIETSIERCILPVSSPCSRVSMVTLLGIFYVARHTSPEMVREMQEVMSGCIYG